MRLLRHVLVLTLFATIVAADGRRHLSPLLRAGEDVFAPSQVGPLPGIELPSYAGYFEVNATDHAELFFWYWPSIDGNASAPVVVWLQVRVVIYIHVCIFDESNFNHEAHCLSSNVIFPSMRTGWTGFVVIVRHVC